MEYSAGTSWLHPQHVPDLHDARTTTNDDWKEPSATMSAGAGPSGAQQQQQGMDLSDFVGLEPIAGEPATQSLPPGYANSQTLYACSGSSTTSSIPPSASSYFGFSNHGNYFLSGDPVPSYAPTTQVYRGWTAAPPPPQLPLSSYSSLNGATSTTQSSPSQTHQTMSSPPQMMIECVHSYSRVLHGNLTPLLVLS